MVGFWHHMVWLLSVELQLVVRLFWAGKGTIDTYIEQYMALLYQLHLSLE